MPITIAFTLTSAIALVRLTQFLLRVRQIREAYISSGRNGQGREIAWFLLRLVIVRDFKLVLLLGAGLGLLAGFRPAGFLIALIPLVDVIATELDLREKWMKDML